jgi:SAM-dependent methyltransferase
VEAFVDRLYQHRFPEQIHAKRSAVWTTLCRSWFSKYIPAGSQVLEVAAGYCEFINNIEAAHRVAVDLNPETRRHAASGVVVHQLAAEELTRALRPGAFDTVFMSNFLEHCRSRDQVLDVLRAAATVLRPNGRVLILGPNFRYCYKDYYDYFDHYLALTDKAVVEALRLAGFEIEKVQPRTLPFSFQGRLPSWPWLVRLYLYLPWAWPLFGKQFFVVGRKESSPSLLSYPRSQAA